MTTRQDVLFNIFCLKQELVARSLLPAVFPSSVDAEIKKAIENLESMLRAIDTLREALAFYAKWLPECEEREWGKTSHVLASPLAIDLGREASEALLATDAMKKE